MPHPALTRRALLLGGAGALVTATVGGCTPNTLPDLPELVLATGPPGAVYREIGGALADELQKYLQRTAVRTRASGASVENLTLLSTNQAQLGFVSLDAMLARQTSPVLGVSAVGRLYDSFLHLVVLNNSKVRTAKDLPGLRVAIGAAGSGTEYTVEKLRRIAGLNFNEVRLTQSEAAKQLEEGTIDAFFTLTGIPTPAISEMIRRQVAIRLVPLAEQAEVLASGDSSAYVPATIPKTTYGSYVQPARTVSVPNLLVAREDLPAEVVKIVANTVFSQADSIAINHPEARRINRSTGIATGPVPLHPGAAAWFREYKRLV
ncbi:MULTISPECIES: TAXI family TRAP transporter solute-binding subunit [unclassified Crossiella]|uniref:TAXI family TRAP transporter solute-binding subunit n=1 Tax=unclassified Crossiella TaxID=2620835 RepID=UPI001FFF0FAF|nr:MULTISPECIES: TAXI family TRAP transporter solute-binding subunit [unclassified Crossiella]MCK2243288.1 TAXI family TRAP transporter solute-binding subunit [Crossiella sp. S99.2]MCK2254243.1 TAXI family TRAP transporter solute-binding subunit [Crossiella sp. S99.1]